QETMRAGIARNGKAYQITVVVHSHDVCPRRMWNQKFGDYPIDNFETVNGANGELNLGLYARCCLVKSYDFARGVDTTDLRLGGAWDVDTAFIRHLNATPWVPDG